MSVLAFDIGGFGACFGFGFAQNMAGLGEQAATLALRRLEVGPLDPAWLGSPGAADRLADDLYRQLLATGPDIRMAALTGGEPS